MKKLMAAIFVMLMFLGCATANLSPPSNITGTIFECDTLLCTEYIEREKSELLHYMDTCKDPAVLGMQQGVVTALINRCRSLEEKNRNQACEDFDKSNEKLDKEFDKAYGCTK